MSYIIKGKLRGQVAPDVVEPLSDATVMFYRIPIDQQADAEPVEDGDTVMGLLSDEEARGKRYMLFAQTRTDEGGEFSVDLTSKTIFGHQGSTHVYQGEPFEVDVICWQVPGRKAEAEQQLVQFTIAKVRPEWEGTEAGRSTNVEFDIPLRAWRVVREAMDAWVVAGRVVRDESGEPAEGVKVQVYDADLQQDDYLGEATTDANGMFRIDFDSVAFRKTPVRGVDYEMGGPDIYFRVESPDGKTLLEEDKERGGAAKRANIGSCFSVELKV